MTHRLQGAFRLPGGEWEFILWAPRQPQVILNVAEPDPARIPMRPQECGYHSAIVERLSPDALYFYEVPDGRKLPDPASRSQPKGVHGPSQPVDVGSFSWTDDAWTGRPLSSSIFYELHVGTYTPAGTFDAVIPHLDELADLGITTLELMPVAQFPGARNWGYDGVHPYAAQNTYGGPCGLQRLVDATHRRGLAVALDVVYNHLGPEGNYLGVFGPYFSGRYRTPWGEAINFDGRDSDPVRRFFIDNALYWLEHFHIDALRLDAIHGIFDFSARHFLAELKDDVNALSERLGRQMHVIAESDLNDARVLHTKGQGGYALDGQWSDDFHHSVHTLLTGERAGYYQDFGTLDQLAGTLKQGWYYDGRFSHFRRRRFGNSPAGIAKNRLVVCAQNHDQVGNRARGDRLSDLVGLDALKLAAGITLLSPFIPLLFMGEEFGERNPFLYFVSHGDADLIEAVRRGRAEEFVSFGWAGEIPDPQAELTFESSRVDHSRKQREPHRMLREFHRKLIDLRNELSLAESPDCQVEEHGERTLLLSRSAPGRDSLMIFHFSATQAEHKVSMPQGHWKPLFQSSDAAWLGPGGTLPPSFRSAGDFTATLHPWSFAVLASGTED